MCVFTFVFVILFTFVNPKYGLLCLFVFTYSYRCVM